MIGSYDLLVHELLGGSDSARRNPGRHAQTDAPLLVAWLNPGQLWHCPSVLDLNWPTGQAWGGHHCVQLGTLSNKTDNLFQTDLSQGAKIYCSSILMGRW